MRPHPMPYRYYEAGNRYYLCVQLQELLELNLAGRITFNSYAKMRKKLVYLEPHDDAPLFIEEFTKASGAAPVYTYHYNPNIPRFRRYDADHGQRLQEKFNREKQFTDPELVTRFYLISSISRLQKAFEVFPTDHPDKQVLETVLLIVQDVLKARESL